MSKTPVDTVAATGAEAGAILVGIEEHPLNQGLRIKVHARQPRGGSRIEGAFDLITAGSGTYFKQLTEHLGRRFPSAAVLINEVRTSGGEECRHILNRNKLRKSDQ